MATCADARAGASADACAGASADACVDACAWATSRLCRVGGSGDGVGTARVASLTPAPLLRKKSVERGYPHFIRNYVLP